MLDESDSEISGDFFEILQSRRTIGLNKEKMAAMVIGSKQYREKGKR